MNTYYINVTEINCGAETTDNFLIDAYDTDHLDHEMHQVLLAYRGEPRFIHTNGEDAISDWEGVYDYGDGIVVTGWTYKQVNPDHVHILRQYLYTLYPDENGILLDLTLRHQAGETLDLSDWEQVFNAVPNHIDENEQFFETFGDELEFVKQQDPNKIWTLVEQDDKQYLSQGYHLVNRLKYAVTEESCPEELIDSLVLWCEFDEEINDG